MLLGVVLTGLMLTPCVVAVACLAGRRWWPVDDFAIIDLRVRDVWSVHTPLTGHYSRPGWNHPGPLMHWALSLLSAPARGAPWTIRTGGALLQGLALGWLGWLAWRRGLRVLLAATAVTAATYYGAGPLVLRDPWNVNVAITVFILFLFLAWFVASGSFRLLTAMVIVGSFEIQAHLSYTLLVLAGSAWAIGCTVVDARRQQRPPSQYRPVVTTAVVALALCWVAPAVDVLVHWPGNLGKIVRYFGSAEHSRVGLDSALRIMASEFRFRPPWAGGQEPVAPFTGRVLGVSPFWLLGALALLAAGAFASRATKARDDQRLVGLAAVIMLFGVVAVAGADQARAYTFGWRPVISAFVVVASLWPVARLVGPLLPRVVTIAAPVIVGGLAAWGLIAAVVRIPSAGLGALTRDEPSMRLVARQIHRVGLPRGPVLVRSTGEELRSLHDGVIDYLDREGVDVRVDRTFGRVFGDHRTIAPPRARTLWYVTEHGSYAGALLRLPGSRLVAYTTPLARAEEAELSALQRRLWDDLVRAKRTDLLGFLDNPFVAFKISGIAGLDAGMVGRVGQLDNAVQQGGGCRCAVVSVEPRPGYPIADVPIRP